MKFSILDSKFILDIDPIEYVEKHLNEFQSQQHLIYGHRYRLVIEQHMINFEQAAHCEPSETLNYAPTRGGLIFALTSAPSDVAWVTLFLVLKERLILDFLEVLADGLLL